MKINQHFPNHAAIIFGDQVWNYREFDTITDKIAAAFIALGIRTGDRIAIHLLNRPEIVFCYYACFKVGEIAVPLNTRLKSPEIKYILNHCQPKLCISQAGLFTEIQPIQNQIPSIQAYFVVDDGVKDAAANIHRFSELLVSNRVELPIIEPATVAAILYTSGTTGRPKGVTHTHRSLELTAAYHAEQVNLTPADVCGAVLPLCYIGGSAFEMLPALSVGAALAIIPYPDPTLVLQNLHQHRVTHFVGMPVLFNALVNHPEAANYNLKALRICLAGGDAVPETLQKRFAQLFGVNIREVCGMTEVIPYALNPQDNKKDIIVRGGSNISPLEVEEVLYQHPAVREAAVIGIPDETWDETVRAFVALRAGDTTTQAELLDFMRPRIAAYKIPEKITFLTKLPKGLTGKIHRKTLRDWARKEFLRPHFFPERLVPRSCEEAPYGSLYRRYG